MENTNTVDIIYKIIVIVFPIALSFFLIRPYRWIKHIMWTIEADRYATKIAFQNGNADIYEREFSKKYNELKSKYKFISKGD